MEEEKQELENTSPLIIIEYTKTLFQVIMNIKEVDGGTENEVGIVQEYESIIQKLEAEIRNHVRVEQQLKLYIETLQFKNDEMQAKLQQYAEKNKELEESITNLKEGGKILNIKQKNNDVISNVIIGCKPQLKPLIRKQGSLKKKVNLYE